jgi:hypothetical protein
MWRASFGRGFGPVVRQWTKWWWPSLEVLCCTSLFRDASNTVDGKLNNWLLLLFHVFIIWLFMWINRLVPFAGCLPQSLNDLEYEKNKHGCIHTPSDVRRTGTPVCYKGVDWECYQKCWGDYLNLLMRKLLLLWIHHEMARTLRRRGRESNSAHAHYTVTDGYMWLSDNVYVWFLSPVLQLTGRMYSGYSEA